MLAPEDTWESVSGKQWNSELSLPPKNESLAEWLPFVLPFV